MYSETRLWSYFALPIFNTKLASGQVHVTRNFRFKVGIAMVLSQYYWRQQWVEGGPSGVNQPVTDLTSGHIDNSRYSISVYEC